MGDLDKKLHDELIRFAQEVLHMQDWEKENIWQAIDTIKQLFEQLIGTPLNGKPLNISTQATGILGVDPKVIRIAQGEGWDMKIHDSLKRLKHGQCMSNKTTNPSQISEWVDAELKSIIGEKVGEASMCWEPSPNGVFDSERAAKIVDEVFESIRIRLGSALQEAQIDENRYWIDRAGQPITSTDLSNRITEIKKGLVL